MGWQKAVGHRRHPSPGHPLPGRPRAFGRHHLHLPRDVSGECRFRQEVFVRDARIVKRLLQSDNLLAEQNVLPAHGGQVGFDGLATRRRLAAHLSLQRVGETGGGMKKS